jgi:aminoglycoside N3'-acetyltransferase
VTLVAQLRSLGVEPGDVLVVHTAFSEVATGTPETLIDALREAIEPGGTLVMPSMSDDDERVFDVHATPCLAMGVVADTFRRLPGVLRSDNPHAFAATGPHARAIVAEHPLDVPHGLDSPIGRVYDLDGKVLLLGVGHGENTMIHLAENLAGVPYRIAKRLTVVRDGTPSTLDYAEIDHCCERFALADAWLDEAGLQRRGFVGRAEARLMRAADVVRVVTARLRDDPLTFLHPPGVDAECDAARASVP